jgi:hypothetical protein
MRQDSGLKRISGMSFRFQSLKMNPQSVPGEEELLRAGTETAEPEPGFPRGGNLRKRLESPDLGSGTMRGKTSSHLKNCEAGADLTQCVRGRPNVFEDHSGMGLGQYSSVTHLCAQLWRVQKNTETRKVRQSWGPQYEL